MVSELGSSLGKLFRDRDDMKKTLASAGSTPVVGIYIPSMDIFVEQLDCEIKQKDTSALTLWHAGSRSETWSASTGAWTAQSALDNLAWVTVCKRAWLWDDRNKLAEGTKSNNINIADGVIQLSR